MQIQARHVQIGLVSTLSLAILAAIGAIFFASSPSVRKIDQTPGVDEAARAKLEDLLRGISHAWRPVDRERLLASAQDDRDGYASVMPWFLQRTDDDLLDEAIEVTGVLGAADLHETIVELATGGPAATRPLALRVAERLGPWHPDDLAIFLDDADPRVRLVAFELNVARPDAPWGLLFEALIAANGDHRRKLIAALPDELPESAIDNLFILVDRVDTSSAVGLVAALGRGDVDSRTEQLLSRLLRESEPEVVTACLDILSRKKGSLEDPSDVWQLVADPTRADRLRARALRCLESTRSYDVDEVLDAAWVFPPLAQYYAARCLLRSGREEGSQLLLNILAENTVNLDDDGGLEAIEAGEGQAGQAAVVASRRLLAWLSGKSPGTSLEVFENWMVTSSVEWNPRQLPAAPRF